MTKERKISSLRKFCTLTEYNTTVRVSETSISCHNPISVNAKSVHEYSATSPSNSPTSFVLPFFNEKRYMQTVFFE